MQLFVDVSVLCPEPKFVRLKAKRGGTKRLSAKVTEGGAASKVLLADATWLAIITKAVHHITMFAKNK